MFGPLIGAKEAASLGLVDRLTFSTFGAAVNEVQRLEALSKNHPSKVIASDAFVGYCGGKWIQLGSEKLRGFEQAVKIFAPDVERGKSDALALPDAREESGMSDAEHLMMLHRQTGQSVQKSAAR